MLMANADNLQTTLSISSLPRELVLEVLALVVASSSIDLFHAKQCCKAFFEVSEENYVYQRVSLDKYPIVPWHENPQVSMFLNKCRRSKNPEALYRKGVVDYFEGKNLDLAMESLREAAKSGHMEATYALGIIAIFGGGEMKQKGINLLGGMKKSGMRICEEF